MKNNCGNGTIVLMNTYELMLIINPQISDADINGVLEASKKILADRKAEVLADDRLGRKPFAHNIKKNRDGFYIYLKVKAEPESIKDFKRSFGLQENILRSMFIKAAEEKPVKA